MMMQAGRIGLAHWGVEQGDTICVLLECSMPLIIRRDKDGNSCTLADDCFDYGFMGEVMDWLKTGEALLETISLC
jgi:hypothetical protein